MSRSSRRQQGGLEKAPATETPPSANSLGERRLTLRQQSFIGPLPPPEVLFQYENAFPGCAERIVALTERQSAHRQNIELMVVESGVRTERVGQYLAFSLFALGLVAGSVLVYFDKSTAGVTAILGSLVTPVGLLIYADRKKSGELLKKWRELIGLGE